MILKNESSEANQQTKYFHSSPQLYPEFPHQCQVFHWPLGLRLLQGPRSQKLLSPLLVLHQLHRELCRKKSIRILKKGHISSEVLTTGTYGFQKLGENIWLCYFNNHRTTDRSLCNYHLLLKRRKEADMAKSISVGTNKQNLIPSTVLHCASML